MVGLSISLSLTLHVATWRYGAATCITIQADPTCMKKRCFVEHVNEIATGQTYTREQPSSGHDSVKSSLISIYVAGKVRHVHSFRYTVLHFRIRR